MLIHSLTKGLRYGVSVILSVLLAQFSIWQLNNLNNFNNSIVLVLTGRKLVLFLYLFIYFLIVASMVWLWCFDFWSKQHWQHHDESWLHLSLCLRLPYQQKLQGDTARTADFSWPKVYSIPYDFILSNKSWEKGIMVFVFSSNSYTWWSPAFLLKAQEPTIPLCGKSSKMGRRLTCIDRELHLKLRQKRKIYYLWKQGMVSQEEYRAAVCTCRQKTRKGKAQVDISQCGVWQQQQ